MVIPLRRDRKARTETLFRNQGALLLSFTLLASQKTLIFHPSASFRALAICGIPLDGLGSAIGNGILPHLLE